MPMFSVIVPVYKAAETVERCVASLVASGGDDLQVILVEDHSPDDSWETCRRLAQKYANVLCVRNDRNRGVSYTRNRALDLVEGKYLLFTDSDDWVDPDYVTSFRRAIEAGNTFAICGYVNHDEKNTGRTDNFVWDETEELICVPLISRLQNLFDGRLLQQLWNKVFVMEMVRRYQVHFDESISIGEDTRFILDYIQRVGVDRVCLINRPLYHYMRDRDGSLMFRVGYESVEEPLKNLRKLYEIQDIPDLEQRLSAARKKTVENYAYLIMHNAGMPMAEKKRLILALDSGNGKVLYRNNRKLYAKERLSRLLHRR